MLFKRSFYPAYDLYSDYGVYVNIAIVCCITMFFLQLVWFLRKKKNLFGHNREVEDQRKQRLNEWMNKPLPDIISIEWCFLSPFYFIGSAVHIRKGSMWPWSSFLSSKRQRTKTLTRCWWGEQCGQSRFRSVGLLLKYFAPRKKSLRRFGKRIKLWAGFSFMYSAWNIYAVQPCIFLIFQFPYIFYT